MNLRSLSLRCFSNLALTGVAILFMATAAAVPARAQNDCGVTATCSVEDLGNDRYRISYVITNVSSAANVIFKWRLSNPSIADEWVSVAFEVPDGWSAEHHVGRIDFQIPNGDGTTQRIYSPGVAAHCGASSSLTFRWTFDRNGGPLPDCTELPAEHFDLHAQGIDPESCNNVGQSFLCSAINLPPSGACCTADGSCTVTTEAECQANGGTYQGDGTDCDPNPCVQPTGACCLSGGVCVIITEQECSDRGGGYLGDGSDCDPHPCTPTPVDPSTWGRIKNIYH